MDASAQLRDSALRGDVEDVRGRAGRRQLPLNVAVPWTPPSRPQFHYDLLRDTVPPQRLPCCLVVYCVERLLQVELATCT